LNIEKVLSHKVTLSLISLIDKEWWHDIW